MQYTLFRHAVLSFLAPCLSLSLSPGCSELGLFFIVVLIN